MFVLPRVKILIVERVMSFIVGAYASAAADDTGDHLRRVAELPGFGGVELPFLDDRDRDRAGVAALDPAWDVVLTAITATVLRNRREPAFGLASPDERGRRAAVAAARDLAALGRAIDEHAGRAALVAVELHSAPTGIGDPAAFATSLGELAELDWGAALVTVEHCDSVAGPPPHQKGYLTLDDELAAVRKFGERFALTVNWGRSAIEGRSAATPVEHVALLREAGRLGGVMFSGVADHESAFGAPWLDAHLPPSEAGSLLGPAELAATLDAAGRAQRFTGLKIALRPAELDADARIGRLRAALELLGRAAEPCP
jgi:hypothetical protein